MKKTNSIFFNEYKKLDKLLGDIYNDSRGVTCYIEDMKKRCPDSMELKTLKHLRYIRNRLAHDTGAFDEECATEKDIVWIKDFYESVLNGSDSLSVQKKRKTISGNWKIVFITVIILVIISILIAVCLNSLIF